jgi:hypothetical protein
MEDDKKRDLLNDQLSRFVDLYKHGYDSTMKGYAIYLAL